MARSAAHDIMAPLFECEMIELGEKGFYYRRSVDGDREIEP